VSARRVPASALDAALLCPDLVFHLAVDPERSVARPDFGKGFEDSLERQRAAAEGFSKLFAATDHARRIVTIDTSTLSAEEVALKAWGILKEQLEKTQGSKGRVLRHGIFH
jgi:thymidylate kinase